MKSWMRRLGWRRRPEPPAPPPENPVTEVDLQKLWLLLDLVNDKSQPNVNALAQIVRNVDILALNVKAFGYALARQLAAALPPPTGTAPAPVGLASKMATQRDIESDWAAHWCAELKVPRVFHRKIWELTFLLQALHDAGHLRPGARGLGFGCGTEPIPSYLAARGVSVTMTDLPPDDSRARDWTRTGQHAAAAEHAHHEQLVDRATFDALVEQRYVDMNALPPDLAGYDFCWSLCAVEHLGSIAQGLDFIRNSVATLRPGGTAIHTMEYNVNPDGPTVDNWMTVLFQRKHLEELAARLREEGHQVAPFDFAPGDGPLDQFIDLPPWADQTLGHVSASLGEPRHLKVAIDGFVATCFGLIVTRGGGV